jgi:Ran GTPase-activating protein (RanGAP) involved in mRNA processing and transport
MAVTKEKKQMKNKRLNKVIKLDDNYFDTLTESILQAAFRSKALFAEIGIEDCLINVRVPLFVWARINNKLANKRKYKNKFLNTIKYFTPAGEVRFHV